MFGIEDFSKPIVDFSNFDPSQLGEALLFGGSILLIGMATIFSVLCLLWAFLGLFKFFFHDLPEKRKTKKKSQDTTEVSTNATNERTVNDGEIIAAISAAIAMAESENSGMKFRVVSFKRI